MRVPLRVKYSGIIVAVLVVSIGIMTYLSIQFFISDKENYIFELNLMTAQDRSSTVNATLDHLTEKIRIFINTYATPIGDDAKRSELLNSLFSQYQEFIALKIYNPNGTSSTLFTSQKLADLGINEAAIDSMLKKKGFSPHKVLSGQFVLTNVTVDGRLPIFAYALPLAGFGGDDKRVVVGIIDAKQLDPGQEDRRKIQEIFIVSGEGDVIAHQDLEVLVAHQNLAKSSIVATMYENKRGISAGNKRFTTEDGRVMLGGYSILKGGLAGVVVMVPQAIAFSGAKALVAQAFTVAAIILLISIVVSIFLAGSVTQPILELAKATRRIAKGDFKSKIRAKAEDEIGDLARSFNRMGRELMEREEALQEANGKLIQSEKMAAFGQLGAGIAHEVKNPLAGILGYAQLAKRKISEDNPIYKNLTIIEKETKRCKEIIENLMKFARQEKAEFEPFNVHQAVQDSIVLVEHQLTINHVKIFRDIQETETLVLGNANQLQQVLMNLMMNAQHAMEPNGGELHISSHLNEGQAEIRIRDTGHGIPENVRQKIFEPFFTTKPAGKGTGLGLSVTYGIITDHKGKITVESEINVGTTFIIHLPLFDRTDVAAVETSGSPSQSVNPTQETMSHV